MTKLLDSLLSGLQSELDATLRDIDSGDQDLYLPHKSPLEMYAFLLHWFVTAAEKVKVSDDVPPPPPTKSKRGRGAKAAGASGRTASRSDAKRSEEAWSWEDQLRVTLALT